MSRTRQQLGMYVQPNSIYLLPTQLYTLDPRTVLPRLVLSSDCLVQIEKHPKSWVSAFFEPVSNSDPSIIALFEPIANSAPSISALFLLSQKERCARTQCGSFPTHKQCTKRKIFTKVILYLIFGCLNQLTKLLNTKKNIFIALSALLNSKQLE